MEAGLEAGAEDVVNDGDIFMLYTDPSSLESVRSALESKNVKIEKAEISMIPQTTVKLSGKDAETMLKLIENLEDNDDVQKVHSNFDIDDEEMAKLSV
jgi:transcriptional/translational regulatory protein YebC/TACO1